MLILILLVTFTIFVGCESEEIIENRDVVVDGIDTGSDAMDIDVDIDCDGLDIVACEKTPQCYRVVGSKCDTTVGFVRARIQGAAIQ